MDDIKAIAADIRASLGGEATNAKRRRWAIELETLAQQHGAHPAITHCDNCGCDWLDNGLNPAACPYCKQPAAVDGDNPYPAPRNRQEAAALAKLALAYLGVTSAHIDAVVARCETDLAAQPGGSDNDR